MSTYGAHLIDKFRTHGILVDTNLLLLYVIGQYDAAIIRDGRFNRIAQYSLDDYELLLGLFSLFQIRVTTAPVLAEVTNWVGKLSRAQEIDCLTQFAIILQTFTEVPLDSFDLMRRDRFQYLGLTDIGLVHTAATYLIVTDDAALAFHINELGLEALNINYIRQERWLSA